MTDASRTCKRMGACATHCRDARKPASHFGQRKGYVIKKIDSTYTHTLVVAGEVIQSISNSMAEMRSAIKALSEHVPSNEFYKWMDVWSGCMKGSVFVVLLVFYVVTGRLLSKEAVAHVLGIDNLPANRMCLTTDEYLHGMISLVNELPRLSMYLVIKGNYNAPERIASNVNQIHSTFKELNLKNDSLRKRFDSIKYDVKRLEEILYDLTLRGLLGTSGSDCPDLVPVTDAAFSEQFYTRLC